MAAEALPVFLHVGLPKTGTTTLQHGLFRVHGQIHPVLEGARPLGRGDLCKRIQCQDGLDYDPAPLADALVRDEAAAAASGTRRCRVFSNEFFTVTYQPAASQQGREVMARRLHELFPGAEILLGLRHPEDAVPSLYVQWLQSYGPFGLRPVSFPRWLAFRLEEPLSLELSVFDVHKVWRLYAELFGRERVRCLPFHELRRDPHAFTDSLCARLGVDAEEGRRHMRGVHRRPRATAGEIALDRLMARRPTLARIRGGLARRMPAAVTGLLRRTAWGRPPDTALPEALDEALRARYADELVRLAEATGLVLLRDRDVPCSRP